MLLYSCSSNIKSNLWLGLFKLCRKIRTFQVLFLLSPYFYTSLLLAQICQKAEQFEIQTVPQGIFPHQTFKSSSSIFQELPSLDFILISFITIIFTIFFFLNCVDGVLKNRDKPMLGHDEILNLFSRPLFQNV